jgi:hypothetical protein
VAVKLRRVPVSCWPVWKSTFGGNKKLEVAVVPPTEYDGTGAKAIVAVVITSVRHRLRSDILRARLSIVPRRV